jgi:murein DD-endopeptidase MepM/ murein hydrolase activator NlpD
MTASSRLVLAAGLILGSAFVGAAAVPAALTAVAAPRFALDGAPAQGGVVRGIAPPGTVSLALDGQAVPLDADRHFILGFDRDQPGKASLVARVAKGGAIEEVLTIAPRDWKIEHVDVAQRPSVSTEEFLRIRKIELARIEEARAKGAPTSGWRQKFRWPARGRISGLFGSQRIYRGEPGAYHSGVDIAPGAGAPVVAPADGIVVLAGPPAFSLEGNLVIVDHGMGLNSAFLHLGSVAVRDGQSVKQGEPIGTVGATGRATGPHLHWSMKWNAARIDPQSLAGAMRD